MDSALVFKYSGSFPGREVQALEAFTESLAFFATQAHEGKCGEPMTIISPSHANLVIVPGTYEGLSSLVRTDEFLDLYTKAFFSTPDLTYEIAAFGEGAQTQMARWSRFIGELQPV